MQDMCLYGMHMKPIITLLTKKQEENKRAKKKRQSKPNRKKKRTKIMIIEGCAYVCKY